MNELDRVDYRQRYVSRLKAYGYDPRTLGWNKGRQSYRFDALVRHVDLDRIESVLDVGCGFGDFGVYLREHGFDGRYLGIDIVPELIQAGRNRNPGLDLDVCDVADLSGGASFDLVTASGVFNAKLAHSDNFANIQTTIRKMFWIAGQAVAADFLTGNVDYREDGLFYMPIGPLTEFLYTLSRRFLVDHQAMPYEYTITLFRDDRVSERAVFAGYGS
jgi:SAM-dependent methyltransferase